MNIDIRKPLVKTQKTEGVEYNKRNSISCSSKLKVKMKYRSVFIRGMGDRSGSEKKEELETYFERPSPLIWKLLQNSDLAKRAKSSGIKMKIWYKDIFHESIIRIPINNSQWNSTLWLNHGKNFWFLIIFITFKFNMFYIIRRRYSNQVKPFRVVLFWINENIIFICNVILATILTNFLPDPVLLVSKPRNAQNRIVGIGKNSLAMKLVISKVAFINVVVAES